MAKSAAEVIGFHLMWDIADVREAIYQPTRYRAPSLYTVGEYYYCAPSGNQRPPQDFGTWDFVHEYCGRRIYRAAMNEETTD